MAENAFYAANMVFAVEIGMEKMEIAQPKQFELPWQIIIDVLYQHEVCSVWVEKHIINKLTKNSRI